MLSFPFATSERSMRQSQSLPWTKRNGTSAFSIASRRLIPSRSENLNPELRSPGCSNSAKIVIGLVSPCCLMSSPNARSSSAERRGNSSAAGWTTIHSRQACGVLSGLLFAPIVRAIVVHPLLMPVTGNRSGPPSRAALFLIGLCGFAGALADGLARVGSQPRVEAVLGIEEGFADLNVRRAFALLAPQRHRAFAERLDGPEPRSHVVLSQVALERIRRRHLALHQLFGGEIMWEVSMLCDELRYLLCNFLQRWRRVSARRSCNVFLVGPQLPIIRKSVRDSLVVGFVYVSGIVSSQPSLVRFASRS